MKWRRMNLLLLILISISSAQREPDRHDFTDDTPTSVFYPYTVSLVTSIAKLDKGYCTLYEEIHACDENNYFKFWFRQDAGTLALKYEIRKGGKVTAKGSHSIPTIFWGVDIRKILSLSAEFMFHSIILFRDYVPVEQFKLNVDVTDGSPREDLGHLFLEKCRKISVTNGDCQRGACKFHTGHQHFNFMDKWGGCMSRPGMPTCNTGYCHNGGKCDVSEFGDTCECGSKGFLRGDWVGEYCSIKKEEDVVYFAKHLDSYETEIDFSEDDKLKVELIPNFEDFFWNYYRVDLYAIRIDEDGLKQNFLEGRNENVIKATNGTGNIFEFNKTTANSSYLIDSYGSMEVVQEYASLQKSVSFIHFTEVHTPGYSLLPAPEHLQIEVTPNDLFKLTWSYSGEIPAKEFLIEFVTDGFTDQEVSEEMEELLGFRSNTTYTITVSAINTIGDTGPKSAPIKYTSHVFEYDPKNHGKYDLAKWFFRESTLILSGRFVYFKNSIRRDKRIERVALLVDTGERTEDLNAIYHAARFGQAYEDHELGHPYVTASFAPVETPSNFSLPRRVQVGDGIVYDRDFYNGRLDSNFTYQVYVVVWYKSGKDTEVSTQYLGEIRLSQIPWTEIFTGVAVGTLILTILSSLFNFCFYRAIVARRYNLNGGVLKKHVYHSVGNLGEAKISEKSLLVEDIYVNDILTDPDYDMTGSRESEIVQSETEIREGNTSRDFGSDIDVQQTFSFVD